MITVEFTKEEHAELITMLVDMFSQSALSVNSAWPDDILNDKGLLEYLLNGVEDSLKAIEVISEKDVMDEIGMSKDELVALVNLRVSIVNKLIK